jgi:hypothetical protein
MKDHPFFKELDKINKKLEKLNNLLLDKPELISKKKLITNNECLKLLSVSSGTLANWRKQGKIPFRQIDNKIYYITAEIIKNLGNSNKHTKTG